MQPRFLLHHSNTLYKCIYILKAPCRRCLIVLENDPLCSLSLTNYRARGLLAGVVAFYGMQWALVQGWLSPEINKHYHTITTLVQSMNLIIMLLVLVKRLSKALRFSGGISISTIAHICTSV